MAKAYRTTPENTERMPTGIPFIIGNEIAERFSFYGMKAILFTYMTEHLVNRAGESALLSGADAKKHIHLFVAALYATPLLGGILADAFFGKYRLIIALSLVYCVGHAVLAIDPTATGLFLGLGIVAIGAGGIKPCVSAHVGDQFGARNGHLVSRVYAFFYLSINLGAAAAMVLTPRLLRDHGPEVGFGVPGVLMAVATLVFWLGRHRYAHIPPAGPAFFKDVTGPEGRAVVGRLALLFAFVALFWTLFDQTTSSWVEQGKRMMLHGDPSLADQMQAANPVFVLLLTPLFTFGVYPLVERRVRLTPMRKIGIGLALAALAFVYSASIESALDGGASISIYAQLPGYALLTSGELLVSITALEYAYTQAPPRMKSFVMSFYLASAAVGNLFTWAITGATTDADGHATITTTQSFLLYAGIMAVGTLLFIPYSRRVKDRSYLQSSADSAPAEFS